MKLLIIDEQINVNQVWGGGGGWGMDVIEGDPLAIGGFLPSALYDSN